MRAAILFTIVWVVGCESTPPNPIQPTAIAVVPTDIRTSRVNPRDYRLEDYWLEHDPYAEGVSLCRTKLREYCSADGANCRWEIDLYTVVAPEVCPLEPIE